MAIELSLENEQRIKIFKALADETRLEIVKVLHRSGKEMHCGEIGDHCEASKSNASYHFRTLREAGLIRVRRDGQTKQITLNINMFDRYLPGFLNTL